MYGSSRCIRLLMDEEEGEEEEKDVVAVDAERGEHAEPVVPAAEGRSSALPASTASDAQANPLRLGFSERFFTREIDVELVDATVTAPPVVAGVVVPPKLRRGESVPTEVYSKVDAHVVCCPNCARKFPKTEFGQHMFLCYHVNIPRSHTESPGTIQGLFQLLPG
jgi:hypothetical protein